jgi:predicted nucleic acid-binding protein
LIYSADPRDSLKQSAAREIIRRTASGSGAFAEQCLFEFVSVTTRRLHVSQNLAIAIVRKWLLILDVIVPPPNIFDAASALMMNHQISAWDARLLATYSAAGIPVMLSEDLQDGGRYGAVTVINPLLPSNSQRLDDLLPP